MIRLLVSSVCILLIDGLSGIANSQPKIFLVDHLMMVQSYHLALDIGAYKPSATGCYQMQLEFYNVTGYNPISSGNPVCSVADPGSVIFTANQTSAYCLTGDKTYYIRGAGLAQFLTQNGHNPSNVNCISVRSVSQQSSYTSGVGVVYAGPGEGFETGADFESTQSGAINTTIQPTGASTCLSPTTGASISCPE